MAHKSRFDPYVERGTDRLAPSEKRLFDGVSASRPAPQPDLAELVEQCARGSMDQSVAERQLDDLVPALADRDPPRAVGVVEFVKIDEVDLGDFSPLSFHQVSVPVLTPWA